MPYIKKERRFELETWLKGSPMRIEDPGILNFCITKLCKYYLETLGESYKTYNEIIGVLECAKLELYRRKVTPYETVKMKKEGDVF